MVRKQLKQLAEGFELIEENPWLSLGLSVLLLGVSAGFYGLAQDAADLFLVSSWVETVLVVGYWLFWGLGSLLLGAASFEVVRAWPWGWLRG